jgi:O-antigen/teichoic acid export membrane protein
LEISKNLKSFFSDSIIYTVLNLLNKAIPFVLLPIVIRMVSTEEFGLYSLFVTLETLLIPIISLNMPAALSSHFYIDKINLKEYLSTIVFSMLILFSIYITISVFIPSGILTNFGITKTNFSIAICTASILGFINLVSALFRLQRKPLRYGIYSIGQSLLLLIFIISFCLWIPSSKGLIFGRAFYMMLFFIITIFILYSNRHLGFFFSQTWFKRAINFAIPTVFYSISAFIFLSSDRFLIQYFLGTEAVGYYAAIFQLASLISILGMSLNAAWLPWLFENLKKKDIKTNYFIVKLSYLLMLGFILAGLLFCLVFSFIAKIILSTEYHPYINIAYPIIMGFSFEGIYLIVSPYMLYAEKTKYNGFIGIIVAILNISLNLILIPFVGISGAAYSTLLSWMSLSVLFFYFSSKVYPMPWFSVAKSIKLKQ